MPGKAVKGKTPLETAIITNLSTNPTSVSTLVELISSEKHWAIRKAVERMQKRGEIIKITERRSEETGRIEDIFMYVGSVPITKFIQIMDTAQIEEESAKRDIQSGVIYDIVKGSVYDPEFNEEKSREYFRRVASALKEEDPRDLLLNFAEWLDKEHNHAIDDYTHALKQSKKELEKTWNRIENIERLAKVIFNNNLGVPYMIGKQLGPFHLKFRRRELSREEPSFDKEKVRECLEVSVLGEAILERTPANPPERGFCEAGTDASMQKFDLSPFRSVFVHTRMAIVTAASVRMSFYDERETQIDVKPEPSEWQHYTEDDAIDEGLLIPPEAYLMLDDLIWERVTSAAQNLRQYLKDKECFLQDKLGRIPDVLFRDGRIFPLEHLFDDYCQPGVHGRVVRKSIEAFRDLVEKVSAPYPNLPKPVYIGAVKRPEVTILSPLMFWYMKYGSTKNKPVWPTMDERKFIFKTMLSDQQVAHHLFGALPDELNPNERWITCRFIRRFISMDPRIARSPAQTYEQWVDFLRNHATDNPGVEPDVEPFAQLCVGAAVSAFFVSLPKSVASKAPADFLGPRYEVLIPQQLVGASVSIHDLRKYEKSAVDKLMTALADATGLEIYPEKLNGDDRSFRGGSEPLFIFPRATTLAHENVKMASGLFKLDFRGFLWKFVIKIMNESRRSGSST